MSGLITGSQARSMASSQWGVANRGLRTNRRGAFYYSCSSHGGYVIDSRCLTREELANVQQYLSPEIAHEIRRIDTGEAVKFRGPLTRRILKYHAGSERVHEVPIFFAEEDCAWAVIEKFTGIRTVNTPFNDPEPTFQRWYGPKGGTK